MSPAATPCPPEFLALAGRLADASRPILRGYFRSGTTVHDKADLSPVTAADREAEAAMRRLIAEAAPGHGVIGEEHGADRADAEYVWVLDPLDGTKAFITGKPLFGTLIALAHRGKPLLGIIDAAALAERWVGAAGHPTTFNGRPLRCRPCPALGEAMLNSTTPDMFRGADADAFARVRAAVRGCNYGGDCYAYGLVALGFIDLVIEAGLKSYDYMALPPILAGAGGLVTDWQGRDLHLASDGRVVAAGDRRAHAAAMLALNG